MNTIYLFEMGDGSSPLKNMVVMGAGNASYITLSKYNKYSCLSNYYETFPEHVFK